MERLSLIKKAPSYQRSIHFESLLCSPLQRTSPLSFDPAITGGSNERLVVRWRGKEEENGKGRERGAKLDVGLRL